MCVGTAPVKRAPDKTFRHGAVKWHVSNLKLQVPLSFKFDPLSFKLLLKSNLSKLTYFNSNGREAYIRNWGWRGTPGIKKPAATGRLAQVEE